MSNWKKGALHTHTFWSDGKSLPETAIHTYREELKFDFVCITDHNIFPEEKNLWIPVIDQKFDLWPPLLYSGDIDREKSLPNCNIEEKKVKLSFAVGDTVSVSGGLFEGYSGTVQSISEDMKTATVLVRRGRRDMPVELECSMLRLAAKKE